MKRLSDERLAELHHDALSGCSPGFGIEDFLAMTTELRSHRARATRMAEGDYSGARAIIEQVHAEDPGWLDRHPPILTLARFLDAALDDLRRRDEQISERIASFVEDRLDWDRSSDAALYAIVSAIRDGAWRTP